VSIYINIVIKHTTIRRRLFNFTMIYKVYINKQDIASKKVRLG